MTRTNVQGVPAHVDSPGIEWKISLIRRNGSVIDQVAGSIVCFFENRLNVAQRKVAEFSKCCGVEVSETERSFDPSH